MPCFVCTTLKISLQREGVGVKSSIGKRGFWKQYSAIHSMGEGRGNRGRMWGSRRESALQDKVPVLEAG